MCNTIHEPVLQAFPVPSSEVLQQGYPPPSMDELINCCFLHRIGLLSDISLLNYVVKFEAYINSICCQESLEFLIESYIYQYCFDRFTLLLDSRFETKIAETSFCQMKCLQEIFATVPINKNNDAADLKLPPLPIDLKKLTQTISKGLPVRSLYKMDTTPDKYTELAQQVSSISFDQKIPPNNAHTKQWQESSVLDNYNSQIREYQSPFNILPRAPFNNQNTNIISKLALYLLGSHSFSKKPNLGEGNSNNLPPNNRISGIISIDTYHDQCELQYYIIEDCGEEMLMTQWKLIVSNYLANGVIDISQTERDRILQENKILKIHYPNVLLKARNEILSFMKENVYQSFITNEISSTSSPGITSTSKQSPEIVRRIKTVFKRAIFSVLPFHKRVANQCLSRNSKSTPRSPILKATG